MACERARCRATLSRMAFHRVFVYGTLLAGEANHHWLRGAPCLGAWRTPACYRLFSLGAYPVLVPGGRHAVEGEMYRVDDAGLALLDRLEDYPVDYLRRQLRTPFGPAWVYYQKQPPQGGRLLPHGNWRRVRARPTVGEPQ